MIFEYKTSDELMQEHLKTQSALNSARSTERQLLRSGNIRPHRLDGRTIVVANRQTFQRFTDASSSNTIHDEADILI